MKASEIRELPKLLDQPDIISFAGGIPDPALFPAEAFRAAYAGIFASGDHKDALQYSVSEGYAPLRRWLSDHMKRLGVPCGIDNILITSGSQQGLDYLRKLFLSPGDTALVGWPTYLGPWGRSTLMSRITTACTHTATGPLRIMPKRPKPREVL